MFDRRFFLPVLEFSLARTLVRGDAQRSPTFCAIFSIVITFNPLLASFFLPYGAYGPFFF